MSRRTGEVALPENSAKASSVCIDGKTVTTKGRFIKVAFVPSERLVEGDITTDPDWFLSQLRSSGLRTDIFTFEQKVPDVTPKYSYYFEWDNAAVIPITTFANWWDEQISHDLRKAVRRSKKLGVDVRVAEFDDAFVEGICGVWNETPIRQGRRFPHYQKDFESVKRENGTYPGRSVYIGAYYNGEMVGFLRMVRTGHYFITRQVLGMQKYSEKKITNALIAKAVEVCADRGASHFIYGKYIYNDPDASLTGFKRHNGFRQMLLPRYYIPLTFRGKIALKLKLHHSLSELLPQSWITALRRYRMRWYKRRLRPRSDKS